MSISFELKTVMPNKKSCTLKVTQNNYPHNGQSQTNLELQIIARFSSDINDIV